MSCFSWALKASTNSVPENCFAKFSNCWPVSVCKICVPSATTASGEEICPIAAVSCSDGFNTPNSLANLSIIIEDPLIASE